jgi:hypothetical protein
VFRTRFHVYPRAAFEPKQFALGDLDPRNPAKQNAMLRFRASDGANLPRLVGLRTSCDELKVKSTARGDPVPDEGLYLQDTALEITVTPGYTPGPRYGTILAEWRDENNHEHESSLQIAWSVPRLYDVSPARVFFGTLTGPQRTVERKVLVRRTDGARLSIRSIETTNPAVTCQVMETTNTKCAVISTVLDVTTLDGALWGELRIHTDDPEQPTLKVPFAAVPN